MIRSFFRRIRLQPAGELNRFHGPWLAVLTGYFSRISRPGRYNARIEEIVFEES